MAKRGKKAKQEKRSASMNRVAALKSPAPEKGPKPRKKASAKATIKSEGELPQIDVPESPPGGDATALARVSQLEADRTNLMAQVAWARAVASEQQKSLEVERARAEKLAEDLDAQRQRIEQLKALSLLDRLLGRHKRI